jgi:hypothetical protein
MASAFFPSGEITLIAMKSFCYSFISTADIQAVLSPMVLG